MSHNELHETAKALVAPGKGILAADESDATIQKRFDAIRLESTEELRCAYVHTRRRWSAKPPWHRVPGSPRRDRGRYTRAGGRAPLPHKQEDLNDGEHNR
jgi:fructose-bisphosphate aldolase class I